MQLKVLSPIWGHEHLDQKVFLEKIRLAGYDGVDLWLPRDSHLKQALFTYLEKFQMVIVTHQYQAEGATFSKFKRSYLENLIRCAEAKPLLINSHTGRDYFSFDQNIELFDIAANFSQKTSIPVAHETHRGRALFSPGATLSFLNVRDNLQITADLSHWVCVTESMLENFEEILSLTFKKVTHIHARVGFEQGPQVPDPRAPEWTYALNKFLGWWDTIWQLNAKKQQQFFTMTTEFGPPPYMPLVPFANTTVADQFEINCFLMKLLRERYKTKVQLICQ